VRVELSSRISLGLPVSTVYSICVEAERQTYNVHGSTIPETVDLDVVRGLDEVGGSDGSIGNESGNQHLYLVYQIETQGTKRTQ
jgi:hypothetical protein